MNNPQRYTVRTYDSYTPDPRGFWVKGHDALKVIEHLRAKIEMQKKRIETLKLPKITKEEIKLIAENAKADPFNMANKAVDKE